MDIRKIYDTLQHTAHIILYYMKIWNDNILLSYDRRQRRCHCVVTVTGDAARRCCSRHDGCISKPEAILERKCILYNSIIYAVYFRFYHAKRVIITINWLKISYTILFQLQLLFIYSYIISLSNKKFGLTIQYF